MKLKMKNSMLMMIIGLSVEWFVMGDVLSVVDDMWNFFEWCVDV